MADPVSATAMLGLSALGTANSISSANAQKKLSQAQSRFELAQQKRGSAEQLARGLAKQNVTATARGAAPGTGSLMNQALAATRSARRNVRLARGSASLSNARSNLSANAAVTKSLIDFGTTFARSAPGIISGFESASTRSSGRSVGLFGPNGRGDPNGIPGSF